jgi:hypothetical protein
MGAVRQERSLALGTATPLHPRADGAVKQTLEVILRERA